METTKIPLPSVEEIVAIFKTRRWTVCPIFGCIPNNVIDGACCLIPAMIVHARPDIDLYKELKTGLKDNNSEFLYKEFKRLYGVDSISFWGGFDHSYPNPDANNEHSEYAHSVRLALESEIGFK